MEWRKYWYRIRHGPALYARVSINDIPFYEGTQVDFQTASGPATHLLVEGINTMTLQLFEAAVSPRAPGLQGPFELAILDDETEPEEHLVIDECKWPGLWDGYPEEERKFPVHHNHPFKVEGPLPRPVYLDSPEEDFPLEGTPEQQRAVFEIQESLRTGDPDRFVEALSLKAEERAKAYPHVPELQKSALVTKAHTMIDRPWNVRAFEPEELVFERRVDGKVAYVRRREGGHAIEATHPEDDELSFATNVLMTRQGGVWRIFG